MSIRRYCRISLRSFDAHFFVAVLPFLPFLHRIFPPYFFAGRIKGLREAKGYIMEELAKLTGVSLEDYMLLEQGETDFSFTFICKCAKACDVEVVDLLEGRSYSRRAECAYEA